jgi:hypothetical protein
MSNLPELITESTWESMDTEQRKVYKLLMSLTKKNVLVAKEFYKAEDHSNARHFDSRAEAYCDLASMFTVNTLDSVLNKLNID